MTVLSKLKYNYERVKPKAERLVEEIKGRPRLARWLVNLSFLLIIYFIVKAVASYLAQPRLVEIMTMSPIAGRVAVATAPAQRGEITHQVTYTGSLVPYFEAEIRSRIQGWVSDVLVDEQDYVKKGRVLVRLDQREIGAKKAQAQANLAFWESEYKRIDRLYQEKALSQFEWDNAKRQYEAAKAQYQEALAAYSYTEITAPFDGWIARREVDPGDLVNPGSLLLRLVDNHRMRIQVKVAEADLEHLRVGTNATVRFPGLSNPNNEIAAKVTTVFPELDPITRTATVEVVVENPKNLLKPDMYAVVDLILQRYQGVLIIPRHAVVEVQGKPTVFVTDGVSASAREVKLGIAQGDKVQVLEGVKEGEVVIYKGNRGLADGQQVNIVEF